MTPRQAERLHGHTRGHPLWVRTLLAELSPAQLRAVEGACPPVVGVVGHGPAVRAALRRPSARRRHGGDQPPVTTAGGGPGGRVGRPGRAVRTLLGTGFVRWDPDVPGLPVEFAHPLYRQAVCRTCRPPERRDLHRAVAGVLTPATVLAHRVAAADGIDDGLADESSRRPPGENWIAVALVWGLVICCGPLR